MEIEELIDQYGDDTFRLCLIYMGERTLAEDAFQETFVKAWRHMASFRGESSMKTWLTHIAVNTCRSMLRTGWLRMLRRSGSVDELLALAAPEAMRDLDLTQAIGRLPGLYREVIVLDYYENMNTREIAQLLHLSANTVSTRLKAARRLLHKALEGDEEV